MDFELGFSSLVFSGVFAVKGLIFLGVVFFCYFLAPPLFRAIFHSDFNTAYSHMHNYRANHLGQVDDE